MSFSSNWSSMMRPCWSNWQVFVFSLKPANFFWRKWHWTDIGHFVVFLSHLSKHLPTPRLPNKVINYISRVRMLNMWLQICCYLFKNVLTHAGSQRHGVARSKCTMCSKLSVCLFVCLFACLSVLKHCNGVKVGYVVKCICVFGHIGIYIFPQLISFQGKIIF